jgi:hypothetical protein
MLNNIPNSSAAGLNALTQIAVGWENSDTSIYLASDKFMEGWNASGEGDVKYQKYGESFQLLFSQLLKISAGENSIEVSPTNA